MKLKFLGTSDGLAGLRRANSSMLLHDDSGEALLIDCGEPVSATLLKLGIDLERIKTLIITHLHSDHAGGFPQLIQTFQLRKRQSPLTVYLPEEGMETLAALLKTMYLYPSILPFEVHWCPIQPGIPVQSGMFLLDFYSNDHLAVYREIARREGVCAPCESFSVAVFSQGRRTVFSGDLKHASELIKLLCVKTDLLVSELIHFTAAELLVLQQKNLPEKIVFTHYRNTRGGVPVDAAAPELKQLGCPIYFAEDLQEFEF